MLRLVSILALALTLVAAGSAAANPWLGRGVFSMAHQGGEDESRRTRCTPTALARGWGGHARTRHPHDERRPGSGHARRERDRTTNGSGSVYGMTLAQVQALDAAYNLVRNAVKGLRDSSYLLRGIRTGKKPPPAGYRADDFRIPTLDEVLAAFPHVPINVEIKGVSDTNTGRSFTLRAFSAQRTASRPLRLHELAQLAATTSPS